jgi:hypothetical protein
MKKVGIFSIVSKNYLAYARVLFDSVREIHPEYSRYLCLADTAGDYLNPNEEHFEVIEAVQLGIPNFQDMTLRYDVMEFNTAVKPFMIQWLFEHTDLDIVIYLDPDIRVYSRMERLEKVFEEGASVVVIPHITIPSEDGLVPNDYHFLQSGVFNLGFIALRRCEESLNYAKWWGRRLQTQCASDVRNNLFTDQRWCDLAPCFLDQLKVFKDPGYNIAYWNLAQREVTYDSNQGWLVNGQPLVFFHFSGVSADKPKMVSKHQNRLQWEDITSSQPLFADYRQALLDAGWKDTKRWPYAYAQAGGLKINTLIRIRYREEFSATQSLIGEDLGLFFQRLCNGAASEIPVRGDIRITKLMALVHRLRPDLQLVFFLGSEDGQRNYARWFEIAGQQEYGLPPELTMQKAIKGGWAQELAKVEIAKSGFEFLYHVEGSLRAASSVLPMAWRQQGKFWWIRLRNALYSKL